MAGTRRAAARTSRGLSPQEQKLLDLLSSAQGEVVPCAHIFQVVWSAPYTPRRKSNVQNLVHRLRRKLEQYPAAAGTPLPVPGTILGTVPGAGYRLPVRAAAAGGWTLPRPPRLIGRERELAHLRDVLLSGERLVSLVGAARIGKTALALQAADDLAPAFPAGVVRLAIGAGDCLDLAALTPWVPAPGAQVPRRSLSDGPAQNRSARGDIHTARLAVVDVGQGASLAVPRVAAALETEPSLRVLVAARTPLGLPQERVIVLGPLQTPAQPVTDESALRGIAATELFLERARAVLHGYTPGEADVPAITAICRFLGGNPGEIERAAARLRACPPPLLLKFLTGDGLP